MENFLKKNNTLFRIIGACCFLTLSLIKFITMIIELFGSIFGVSSPLHSFLLCSVYAFLGIVLLLNNKLKNNLLLLIGAGALAFFELIYFFVGFGNGSYRASYLFGSFNFLVFLLAFFDLLALLAMVAVVISKLVKPIEPIAKTFFYIPAGVVITVLFFAIIFKIILGSSWSTSGTYLNFISIFNRLLLTGGVFAVCYFAISERVPQPPKAAAPRPATPYQQYTQPQYQPQQYSQPIGNQQQIQQQLQQRYNNQPPQAPQAPVYQAPVYQAPAAPQVPETPQVPEVPAAPEVPQAPEAPQAPAADPVAELKKYKDLLDMGIISQEDFDAKKRQILGF